MQIKKLAALFLAAALLPLSGCAAFGGRNSSDNGKMRSDLSAVTCAQEMGVGINLGNTMEAYWASDDNATSGASVIGDNTPNNYETCWGAVVTTQECIDGMAAAGFETVRVPVYWGNMMEDDGSFTIDPAYIARVQEIVDYCRNAGLYVIINCHHYDEFLIKHYTQEEVLHATAVLWKQIAEYFQDYSDYLIFEGFNEALGGSQEGTELSENERFDYVNAMNQTFVDTVRATGGNNADRILIVSGYYTNIDNTTRAEFQMPSDSADDKLMVSVHYIDNSVYWRRMVGNDRWMEYSKAQCDLLQERFTDQGIPVFVGECTSIYAPEYCIKHPQYEGSSLCLQMLLDMAADYGFVPVLWDVNDNFYSRTDCKIKEPADQAVITEVAERIHNRS